MPSGRLDEKWTSSNTIVNDAESTSKRFMQFAPEYDMATVEWGYRAPELIADLVKKYLPLESRVVDAGCGTGLGGSALQEKGYIHLTGFDLSPEMLSLAENKQVYTTLNAVNMLSLPYPYIANQFDGLICIGVLSFFTDISQILDEFSRITRPGGLLFLTLRDDLYLEYKQNELFEKLLKSGCLEQVENVSALPYLPDHSDYREEVLISYHVYRVLTK